METTLNKICEHSLIPNGWTKLLNHLDKTQADDDPISILTILNSNGLDDALRCLRAVDGHQKEMRLYAVWCARQVQHLMTDPRSIAAIDVADRHANGEATDEELSAARASAWDAARDEVRTTSAWYAALDEAWYAAVLSAWSAAGYEARAAARAEAWAVARAAQEAELRRVLSEIEGMQK